MCSWWTMRQQGSRGCPRGHCQCSYSSRSTSAIETLLTLGQELAGYERRAQDLTPESRDDLATLFGKVWLPYAARVPLAGLGLLLCIWDTVVWVLNK